MALIHCDFYSEVLGTSSAMTVILPPAVHSKRSAKPHPTLWLLHGLMDDHTTWVRQTSLERYVEGLGLAVVMPSAGRSFYADMARGYRYWTFVSEELPRLARAMFPLSAARQDNFVAGLSMGGYGAFKLALRCPDRFAAAASLSGSLDMTHHEGGPVALAELETIFGPLARLAGSDNDLLALAKKMGRSRGQRPALYQWCGTEDYLYEDNLRFRNTAKRAGLDLTYEEGPGTHEWACWDRQIRRVLEWLPLQRKAR
jgi:putative tributyrin esterase